PGWVQALWAVAYVSRPMAWLAVRGLVANAATVVTWAWAHLMGLPFGPEPGHLEPTTLTDVMATLFEVALVAWLLAALMRRRRQTSAAGSPIGLAVLVALIAVVA